MRCSISILNLWCLLWWNAYLLGLRNISLSWRKRHFLVLLLSIISYFFSWFWLRRLGLYVVYYDLSVLCYLLLFTPLLPYLSVKCLLNNHLNNTFLWVVCRQLTSYQVWIQSLSSVQGGVFHPSIRLRYGFRFLVLYVSITCILCSFH